MKLYERLWAGIYSDGTELVTGIQCVYRIGYRGLYILSLQGTILQDESVPKRYFFRGQLNNKSISVAVRFRFQTVL